MRPQIITLSERSLCMAVTFKSFTCAKLFGLLICLIDHEITAEATTSASHIRGMLGASSHDWSLQNVIYYYMEVHLLMTYFCVYIIFYVWHINYIDQLIIK